MGLGFLLIISVFGLVVLAIGLMIGAIVIYDDYEFTSIALGVVALLLLPVGLPSLFEAFEWSPAGHGTHVGYVTAVGKYGNTWQTWHVHFKTDTQSTQEDSYCVRPKDANLVPQLQEAADKHTRVQIDYDSYLVVDWGECESNQDAIVGVKAVSA